MKFTGIVQKNSGRGKQLGFPTANILAPADLQDGLYLGLTEGAPALVFVGANTTFGETDRRAEIYILDFDNDIYGRQIEVETLKKIRDVIKFDSAEALVAQMQEDERVAKEFFANYNISN